jgi:hypothetical protein
LAHSLEASLQPPPPPAGSGIVVGAVAAQEPPPSAPRSTTLQTVNAVPMMKPLPPPPMAPAAQAAFGAAPFEMSRSASIRPPERKGAVRNTPPPEMRRAMSLDLAAAMPTAAGGSAGAAFGEEPEPEPEAPVEPAGEWMDFDTLRLPAPEERNRRGRLVREEEPVAVTQRRVAAARIESISPPGTVRDPRDTRGLFDHRYDADGLVEVPSDAQVHRLTLGTGETTPRLGWRTVPRETADVFREAELKNPFDAPLLAGPVDVYVEGTLLASAAIEHIDRGGTMRVGMGVEDRVRVARNVRTTEEEAGLLGGSTRVEHAVGIELVSSLGREAEVEVLERVPVSDEKGLEVEVLSTKPEAQKYDQAERGAPVRGGLRWRLPLPAGAKASIELRYRIVLPSKNEVVGGNRRD